MAMTTCSVPVARTGDFFSFGSTLSIRLGRGLRILGVGLAGGGSAYGPPKSNRNAEAPEKAAEDIKRAIAKPPAAAMLPQPARLRALAESSSARPDIAASASVELLNPIPLEPKRSRRCDRRRGRVATKWYRRSPACATALTRS